MKFIKVKALNGKNFYVNIYKIISVCDRLGMSEVFAYDIEKGTENKKGSLINLCDDRFPLHVVESAEEVIKLIGEARLT